MARSLKSTFERSLGREEQAAKAAQERLAGFDPFDVANRAAQGAAAPFFRNLQEDVEGLRGQQVRLGRLRSGFGGQDESRFVRDRTEMFTNQLAALGPQVAGLELGALGLENRSRDRFLELLSAGMDRETAEKNAEFGFDDFLSGIGGIVGGVIPFL